MPSSGFPNKKNRFPASISLILLDQEGNEVTMKTRLIRMIIMVSICTTALQFSAQQPTLQQSQSSESNDQNAVSSSPAKVVRTDLEKMQALLEQMQRNVAFVSPGDTPLKHQFQLEIEMWQLLIRDMQKKTSTQPSQ